MIVDMIELNSAQNYTKEQLNAAKMAEFIWAPKTEVAKCFLSELERRTIDFETDFEPRDRKRRAADTESFRRAIGAFAADLLCHYSNQEAAGFMYRPASREEFADTLVSSRSFEQLVRFWQALGLIEATGAIQVKHTFDGYEIAGDYYVKARRFRATDKLISLAALFSITPENIKEHFEEDMTLVRVVIVRAEKKHVGGKKVPSRNIRPSGSRYEAEVNRIKAINNHLRTAGFDLMDPPRVYRLFNRGDSKGFDFNMGGRLYCGSQHNWQEMSSEERSKITCRGERIVEIDVRASHLFILYASQKQPWLSDEDPYHIPGIAREVVKGLIVATTGKGELPSRWPIEMNRKYKAQHGRALSKIYRLGDVIGKLKAKHPILETIKKGQMDWARLQFEESECFVQTMLELGNLFEVGSLPVHDSLIVAERHSELVQYILGQAYQRRFGARPTIIVK